MRKPRRVSAQGRSSSKAPSWLSAPNPERSTATSSALAGSPLAALGVRLGPRRRRPRRRISRRGRRRRRILCNSRRARCHVSSRLAPRLRLDGVSARLGGSGSRGVVRRCERSSSCSSIRFGTRPRSLRFRCHRRARRSLSRSRRARRICAGITCRRRHRPAALPCRGLCAASGRLRRGLQARQGVRRQLRSAWLRGRLAPGARRLRQLSARAVLRRRRRARQLSHQRRLHAR